MPNFDGGHYFYTGLFPVALEPVKRKDGSVTVPSHLLRETLASLPNFSQVREAVDATRKTDRVSPFARCRSTHFARLAVIDDPAFNGRDPVDAVGNIVRGLVGKGVDLAVHQPVDHLSRAWLLFAADFDATDELARDRWAEGLWQLMQPELKEIFGHCLEFEHVDSPETFAAYLDRGQIETTMSFNDYWIEPMNAPTLSLKAIGAAILGPPLLLGGLVAWWRWPIGWGDALLILLAVLLGLGVGFFIAYKIVMKRGAKAFPTAPHSDLKSVLKGLLLQQRFTRFAIQQQGVSPEELHAAFGDFLAEVRPENPDHPTQPPGVLHS